ncbi:MAG TPA: (2Fe-2S)-binding protein [Symbiobacteriaceae bacterium]|jgi:sarcosine oxidase subunit alpha
MSGRVTDHPILGRAPERNLVSFIFNGQTVQGYEGEPIAAALLALGIRVLRRSEVNGEARGLYCGIGHCFECRVVVNGEPNLRSCLTPVRASIVVESAVTPPGDWNGGEPA